MGEPPRPLDALNNSRNKRVIIELNNSVQYIGKLKAFDIHINTVLEDAEEMIEGKVGIVFIRGNMINIISPSE